MLIVGELINASRKQIGAAIENKDKDTIQKIALQQFENGADFICAGMFDFQVREDAIIANKILAANLNRQRPWCA